MKLISFFIPICLILSSTLAYPTTSESHPDDDAEFLVPNRHHSYDPEPPTIPSIPTAETPVYRNFGGTVDPNYGVYYPGFYNYFPVNPYNWNWNVFSRFSNLLHQLRDQAVATWSRVPSVRPSFSLWPSDLEQNGNTTSTVEVIDGHKVIINDTVFIKHTEFGETVVKVRVVDVKPLDEDIDTNVEIGTKQPDVFVHNDGSVTVTERGYPTTVNSGRPSKQPESRETFDDNSNHDVDADVGTGSPEEIESSNENEITKEIDDHNEEIELNDKTTTETQHNNKRENSNELENFESLTSSEWNQINKQQASNEALETFDKTFNEHVNTERNDNSNRKIDDNGNENYIRINSNSNEYGTLDEFDNKVPIDLSNDIAVNQMLADQGAPFNPDAEVFNVNEFNKNNNNNRQHWTQERYQTLKQPQHQQYHQQWQQRPQPIAGQPFEYLPFYPAHNTNNRRIAIKK